jgi:hypothetical protein
MLASFSVCLSHVLLNRMDWNVKEIVGSRFRKESLVLSLAKDGHILTRKSAVSSWFVSGPDI